MDLTGAQSRSPSGFLKTDSTPIINASVAVARKKDEDLSKELSGMRLTSILKKSQPAAAPTIVVTDASGHGAVTIRKQLKFDAVAAHQPSVSANTHGAAVTHGPPIGTPHKNIQLDPQKLFGNIDFNRPSENKEDLMKLIRRDFLMAKVDKPQPPKPKVGYAAARRSSVAHKTSRYSVVAPKETRAAPTNYAFKSPAKTKNWPVQNRAAANHAFKSPAANKYLQNRRANMTSSTVTTRNHIATATVTSEHAQNAIVVSVAAAPQHVDKATQFEDADLVAGIDTTDMNETAQFEEFEKTLKTPLRVPFRRLDNEIVTKSEMRDTKCVTIPLSALQKLVVDNRKLAQDNLYWKNLCFELVKGNNVNVNANVKDSSADKEVATSTTPDIRIDARILQNCSTPCATLIKQRKSVASSLLVKQGELEGQAEQVQEALIKQCQNLYGDLNLNQN